MQSAAKHLARLVAISLKLLTASERLCCALHDVLPIFPGAFYSTGTSTVRWRTE